MRFPTAYGLYCLVHIPITLLVDSCLCVPEWLRPGFQQAVVEFHVTSNHDFLLRAPPTWLVVFGALELLFQLPFFFFAAYGFLVALRPPRSLARWVAVYGFNAALTTFVCLVEILVHGGDHGLTPVQVWLLAGVYLPTFLIPLVLFIDGMCLWDGPKQKLE